MEDSDGNEGHLSMLNFGLPEPRQLREMYQSAFEEKIFESLPGNIPRSLLRIDLYEILCM